MSLHVPAGNSKKVHRNVVNLIPDSPKAQEAARRRLLFSLELKSKARAEQHLHDFVKQAWPLIRPGVTYLDNWHIVLISEYLMAVSMGLIKRLWINIPPRYMKSTLVSIAWPCWEWAVLFPSQSWVFASYAYDLSYSHSLKRRDIILSEWYQSRWGSRVKLRKDHSTKADFANTAGGQMFSTSVGGSCTGLGGNRLVIDDPSDPRRAISNVERERANEWYYDTFESRLDDKINGTIVGIQQRLHQRDMTGVLTGLDITDLNSHVLQGNGWTLLRIPLVAEQDEDLYSPLPGHRLIHSRKEGELLWPEREGPEEVQASKVLEYVFAAQKQQRPSPKAGAMFKREWFLGSSTTRYPFTLMLGSCRSMRRSTRARTTPTWLSGYGGGRLRTCTSISAPGENGVHGDYRSCRNGLKKIPGHLCESR